MLARFSRDTMRFLYCSIMVSNNRLSKARISGLLRADTPCLAISTISIEGKSLFLCRNTSRLKRLIRLRWTDMPAFFFEITRPILACPRSVLQPRNDKWREPAFISVPSKTCLKSDDFRSRCFFVSLKLKTYPRPKASTTSHYWRAGQADKLARPLARRRARTWRPFLVAIRARKPWVRARLIVLGWNVRFMGIPGAM